MSYDEQHDDGLGGRSRRRREVSETARFGFDLARIPSWHLAAIPLPDHLLEAVEEARKITAHRGRARQIAYVDGLLREMLPEEQEAIARALAKPPQEPADAVARTIVPSSGRWLDRLLAEGDPAVEELLEERPGLDRQQVRQLLRNAQKGKPAGLARLLDDGT